MDIRFYVYYMQQQNYMKKYNQGYQDSFSQQSQVQSIQHIKKRNIKLRVKTCILFFSLMLMFVMNIYFFVLAPKEIQNNGFISETDTFTQSNNQTKVHPAQIENKYIQNKEESKKDFKPDNNALINLPNNQKLIKNQTNPLPEKKNIPESLHQNKRGMPVSEKKTNPVPLPSNQNKTTEKPASETYKGSEFSPELKQKKYPSLWDKQIEKKKQEPIVNQTKLQMELQTNIISKDGLKGYAPRRQKLLRELKQLHTSLNVPKSKYQLNPEEIFKMSTQLKRAKQIRYELNLLSQLMKNKKKKDQMERKYQFFRYNYPTFLPLYMIPPQPKPLYIPSQTDLLQYDKKRDLIVYTPAGRQLYLEVVYQYLVKQRDSFFQWHLWINTRIASDLAYINKLAEQNAWIKLIRLQRYEANFYDNFVLFWKADREKDKVYLKIDDDIVWMSQDFIGKMWEARIKNPQPIFILPNIINNQIIGYIHQRAGNLVLGSKTIIEYNVGGNYWKLKQLVKDAHQQFLQSAQNNGTDKWKTSFTEWQLLNYERISINSLIYFGNTLQSMDIIGASKDDQQIYSADVPYYYRRKILIINDPICAHEAFGTQRRYLDSQHPQIIQRYRKLIGL